MYLPDFDSIDNFDNDYEDNAPDDSYLDGEFDYHDSFDTAAEDRYLDSYHEGLTDIGDFGDF